jgi:hypothetical protein
MYFSLRWNLYVEAVGQEYALGWHLVPLRSDKRQLAKTIPWRVCVVNSLLIYTIFTHAIKALILVG